MIAVILALSIVAFSSVMLSRNKIVSRLHAPTAPLSDLIAAELPASSDSYSFYDNKVAVKLTKTASLKAQKRTDGKTGTDSLDKVIKSFSGVKFTSAFIPTKYSNKTDELFDWYVIKVTNKDELVEAKYDSFSKGFTAIQKEGINPEIYNQKQNNLDMVSRLLQTLSTTSEVIVAEPIAEPKLLYSPNDYLFSSGGTIFPNPTNQDMWWLHRINPYGAWDILNNQQIYQESENVVVAVIDSGIDFSHPDFEDQLWINSGEIAENGVDDDQNGYIDDYRGWDFWENDANPQDDHGHGTLCAGIVAARGDNDTTQNPKDGKSTVGTVWNRVKIMPLRFYGNSSIFPPPTPMCNVAYVGCALHYAADMGAQVSSNSWVSWGDTLTRDLVRYGQSKGMVSVSRVPFAIRSL